MMTSPTILICLPTYHRPESLERALLSVRAQTMANYVVWIVKDGCADASSVYPRHCDKPALECPLCVQTVAIGRQAEKHDRRFRFFVLPANFAGHGWAPRNFAILNTDEEFIAYLDDDNWIEPHHIESLYDGLQQTNADIVLADSRIYEDGVIVDERRHLEVAHGSLDTSEIMHRRALLRRFGGWKDDRLVGANDRDIFTRWVSSGACVGYTHKLTLNYARIPRARWGK